MFLKVIVIARDCSEFAKKRQELYFLKIAHYDSCLKFQTSVQFLQSRPRTFSNCYSVK